MDQNCSINLKPINLSSFTLKDFNKKNTNPKFFIYIFTKKKNFFLIIFIICWDNHLILILTQSKSLLTFILNLIFTSYYAV